MTLEAVHPIRVRLGGHSHELQPGQRIDLPEDKGRLLLERAPGKLRIIGGGSPVTIEPAASNARPVYWENADGVILGPAIPEYLARVQECGSDAFWVIVTHDGLPRWIRSDRLRSRRAFETQPAVRIEEPIRDR